jgi:hypothetical protein
MTKDEHRKLIARQLAKFFATGDTGTRACACTGLSGVCVDCSLWWDMFLQAHTAKDVATMVDLYRLCKERISANN